MMLKVSLLVLAMSSPAMAAISCPPSLDGFPLARTDGGSLYLGDPAQRMLLAPSRMARSMQDSNVWALGSQQPVTLVCQYSGTRRALARSVPGDVRMCVQSLATNTFVCQ